MLKPEPLLRGAPTPSKRAKNFIIKKKLRKIYGNYKIIMSLTFCVICKQLCQFSKGLLVPGIFSIFSFFKDVLPIFLAESEPEKALGSGTANKRPAPQH